MSETFEYHLPGRRPSVWLGLAFTAGLLFIAALNDAPWWIWTIWGAVAAALVWMLIANPVSTLHLTDQELRWREGKRIGHVPLSEIAQIKITEWSDGGPDCAVTLTSGARIDIPSTCLPTGAQLERQLSDRGLPVTRS